jgi:hypothetical protein
MPPRTAKRKPVTLDEIESGLDLVARLMHKAGREAELYLPIWRALARERDKRVEADAILAAARERLTRSSGRTAAQPSLSSSRRATSSEPPGPHRLPTGGR